MPSWKKMDTWDKIKEVATMIAAIGAAIAVMLGLWEVAAMAIPALVFKMI